MTPTKPDPLSPERAEAALDRALEELEELSSERSADGYYDALNGDQREWNERLTAEYSTFAALARAHLDATKREPPAKLVEVIEQQIVATFPGDSQLPSAIARAVEAFLGSRRSLNVMDQVFRDHGHAVISDVWKMAIRAALGATEEST